MTGHFHRHLIIRSHPSFPLIRLDLSHDHYECACGQLWWSQFCRLSSSFSNHIQNKADPLKPTLLFLPFPFAFSFPFQVKLGVSTFLSFVLLSSCTFSLRSVLLLSPVRRARNSTNLIFRARYKHCHFLSLLCNLIYLL